MEIRLPHLAPSPHLDIVPPSNKGFSRKATVISPIQENISSRITSIFPILDNLQNVQHVGRLPSREKTVSRDRQRQKERGKIKSRDESRNQMSRALSRNLSRASFMAPTRLDTRSKSVQEIPSPFDPEADYDYDFDSDEEYVTPTDYSNTVDIYKEQYVKTCKKMKVVPSGQVLQQFGKDQLSFRGLNLTQKEMKAAYVSILNNGDIEKLDVSWNPLSVKDISYALDVITANKIIHTLVLQDCLLSGRPLKYLSTYLKKSTALQYLDLSFNGLNDNDAENVADIIEYNDSIRRLILAHNMLGDSGAILGLSLQENETLKELDVSWNHFRSRGAVGLALGLKKNISLVKLCLAWNGFGFEGCAALGDSLQNNTSILHLDLACNRIHPPALFELIKGLLSNKSMRYISLSHNPITAPMTSILLERIKNCPQSMINELDLKGVVVDKHFNEVLEEIREKKPSFTVHYDVALPINKTAATTYDPSNIFNIDPIRILYFMKEHMRTLDLFLKLDKDGSNTLTRDEMMYAFEMEGYPISEEALDTVMGYLDTNKDGEIDLLELIQGERKLKRKIIEENETEKMRNSPMKTDKKSYSQTFRGTKPKSNLPNIK